MDGGPDKLILITGGTSGLGLALATQLLDSKTKVIVTSRKADFNETTSLPTGSIFIQQLDVTCESSVLKLFSWVASLPEKLTVLINNAGTGVFKPLEEITLDEWNATMQTNLTGSFLCAREAFRLFKLNGGGRIINIGSIANKIPLINNLAYGASKWGLNGLSVNLAEEGRAHRIQITHVTLGATYTDIWKSRPEFCQDDMLSPKDVAAYLAHIVLLPLSMAVNHVEILPEKGVL